jgi:hypothetical protein
MSKNLLKIIWNKKTFQSTKTPEGSKAMQNLYGEITQEGTNFLIEYLKENNLISNSCKFLDAGSGYGKLVFHMALLDFIKVSHGIEILKEYNDIALENLKELKEGFPINKVSLICEGVEEYSNKEYDIIYSNNLSWDKESEEALYKINPNALFITTKNPNKHKCVKIKEINKLRTKFSWTISKLTPVYIYTIEP